MVSAYERQHPEQDPPGYRLLGRLGRGAQADVMLAERIADARQFAIKVVRHDALDRHQPDAVARLRREGRVLQAIESPHVVAVHASLTTRTASYLVMDLLAGKSLAAECAGRAGIARLPLLADAAQVGPTEAAAELDAPDPDQAGSDDTRVLTLAERERVAPSRRLRAEDVPASLRTSDHTDWVVGIGIQIARGLTHLHEVNLFHRDIKPANVMLVDDGARAVITDFGMAHQIGVSTITHVDYRSGTPHYWSPEQASGGGGTAASDVFSLGATLFDCLTGWSPLHGQAMLPPARWRLPRLRRLRPDLPHALLAVVTRALEPDPRDRYQDGAALLADLERCQRHQPIRIPFAFGRLWRHHGRAALVLLAVAWTIAAGFWITNWLDDRNLTARIATAARSRDAGLGDAWRNLTPQQQDDLLQPLQTLFADDRESLLHLARTCELAVLPVAATDAFHVAACSVDQPPPALDKFVRPVRGAALLARPGAVWLLVVPTTRSLWWGENDPLCLSYLRHATQDALGEALAPWIAVEFTLESLRNWLPPDPWLPVPPEKNAATAASGAEFFVLRQEIRADVLHAFLRFHSDRHAVPAHLAHNAHPEEPGEVLPRLSTAPAPRTEPANDPGNADFWTAWRFATSVGASLPTRSQWERAAKGAAVAPDAPRLRVAADAPPGLDVSTCGAQWMLGNASEWIAADTYSTSPWAFVPANVGRGGFARQTTQARHGIRLVRYRIPLQH